MTAAELKRMRELQRKDSLTRAEHRELDELEAKFDDDLDELDKEGEEKEPEPKEGKEPEPKKEEPEKEPEPKEEKEPEPKEEKEPEPKEKPKVIAPENDHPWYKKRKVGRFTI